MGTKGRSGPYIPRADGRFREWLENFAAVIAEAPATFQIPPTTAAALLDLSRRYAAAYAAANAPGTRGGPRIVKKNAVRREAWKTVRPIAMRIKFHRGISDAHKIRLGVRSPQRRQSRIPAPTAVPALELLESRPRRHRLRFHNLQTPTSRAKPYGAAYLDLRIALSRRRPLEPRPHDRVEQFTRHVFTVVFDQKDVGRTATYFGRWITKRGKPRPWSRGVSGTVV